MEVAHSQLLHIFIVWQASIISPLLTASSEQGYTSSLCCDQPMVIFFTVACPSFLSQDNFKQPHECKWKANYMICENTLTMGIDTFSRWNFFPAKRVVSGEVFLTCDLRTEEVVHCTDFGLLKLNWLELFACPCYHGSCVVRSNSSWWVLWRQIGPGQEARRFVDPYKTWVGKTDHTWNPCWSQGSSQVSI